MATDVVARRSPELRPTGTPTARANRQSELGAKYIKKNMKGGKNVRFVKSNILLNQVRFKN